MPFDPQKFRKWTIRDVDHAYGEKEPRSTPSDLAAVPSRHGDLKFVYERDVVALPTMVVVLAPLRQLAGEQGVERRLTQGPAWRAIADPASGARAIRDRHRSRRIVDLLDKGKEKGAVPYAEHTLFDKASGEPIATMTLAATADLPTRAATAPPPASDRGKARGEASHRLPLPPGLGTPTRLALSHQKGGRTQKCAE